MEPNQSLEPTRWTVTDRAEPRSAPLHLVAHLNVRQKDMKAVAIILGLLALSACRRNNMYLTECRLDTGDILIEEATSHEGFVESVTTTRLFFQKNGKSNRELIVDGGPVRLKSNPATQVWQKDGWLVIKIGSTLFYRRESAQADQWMIWYLNSNRELFESVREVFHANSQSFKEIREHERSRIYLDSPTQRYGIGEGFDEFYLPYEIESIDFKLNRVIARKNVNIPCLPETIVFMGASSDFGRWVCRNIQ